MDANTNPAAETQNLNVRYEPATLLWDGGTREVAGATIVLAYDDGTSFSGDAGPQEGDSLDCWMDASLISHVGCERPDPVLDAIIEAVHQARLGKSGVIAVEVDFVP